MAGSVIFRRKTAKRNGFQVLRCMFLLVSLVVVVVKVAEVALFVGAPIAAAEVPFDSILSLEVTGIVLVVIVVVVVAVGLPSSPCCCCCCGFGTEHNATTFRRWGIEFERSSW